MAGGGACGSIFLGLGAKGAKVSSSCEISGNYNYQFLHISFIYAYYSSKKYFIMSGEMKVFNQIIYFQWFLILLDFCN